MKKKSVLNKQQISAWKQLAPVLALNSPAAHGRALRLLEGLMDEVGERKKHPFGSLLGTLAILIEAWETEYYPIPDAPPRKVLAYLMEAKGLTQSDMKELGSQDVVSEILSGGRDLTVRQVRQLAKRFGVSPAVFI